MSYPLLTTIDTPDELRKLDRGQLSQLADELRAFIIESVSKTGGHLSSNLGTVELTLALHYVFNTPEDRIVWDVGHQSYAHKILTGRREGMARLRMLGGISGFPRRDESIYDTFGTAHSSTSISAALGMAIAARQKGESRRAIAVIGDGAMSAGMAYEAMNNAGVSETDLLVILNDNDMSISPPVGALNRYLARLMSGQFYAKARDVGRAMLARVPPMFELARRLEEHAKGMVVPATMFEEFGFNYVGPIDGHDLESLVPTLQNMRELRGPQFLHVVTRKGHGYKLAEADPVLYHGPGPFDPSSGTIFKEKSSGPAYSQVFGQWLCDMAERDPRVVGITPAMREGSGLVEFSKKFPDRYFDVAIAEQHAVTLAAGMACEGARPVVAIYSTFLQRGYDQLIHDVALQNLPVTFAVDRGGLVGGDGATHQGAFDLTYLRCIPNMVVMTPSDENECRQMLYTGVMSGVPAAVRYPRGSGPGVRIEKDMSALPIGRAEIRREGRSGLLLLAFGTVLAPCMTIAERLDATLVNMRFVKPLDEELVHRLAAQHECIVTIEENAIAGGAGSAVSECLDAAGAGREVHRIGIPDRFIEHGSREDCLVMAGLDAAGLERAITRIWPARPAVSAVAIAGGRPGAA